MATLDDQVIKSFGDIVTQGPNIKIDANVLQRKKKPLTFEQIKELLEKGESMPEGFTVPTGLSVQQVGQLPGGMSAYSSLYPMIESIKGTAGFGKGPGGVSEDINVDNPPQESPITNTLHNCPDGYYFDETVGACVNESQKDDDTLDNMEKEASYQSFVDMVAKNNPQWDGSMDQFNDLAGGTYLGSLWDNFYNDNTLLTKYVGLKAKGFTKYPEGVFKEGEFGSFKPTPNTLVPFVPDQQKDDTSQNNQKTIIQSSSPATTSMSAVGNVNMGGSGIQDPSQISQPSQKEEPVRTGGTPIGGGGGMLGGGDYGGVLNKGGLVEQTKPLQLADVSLKMQEGGQVPVEQPIQGMPMPSGQPAGFIQDPSAAPAPDNPMDAMQGQGQRDDVLGELPEGTFVINAMAVQLAGIDELDNMVEKAYETLAQGMRKQGVDEGLVGQLIGSSRNRAGVRKQEMVDVAVSNGEYIIPPEIVPVIGEDKLRKINDRGLRKLEELKPKEKKQQSFMPQQGLQEGGFTIARNPDGTLKTEKMIDDRGREVSRLISKEEQKKTQPVNTKKQLTDLGIIESKTKSPEIEYSPLELNIIEEKTLSEQLGSSSKSSIITEPLKPTITSKNLETEVLPQAPSVKTTPVTLPSQEASERKDIPPFDAVQKGKPPFMSVFGVPEGSAKPALPPEVLMEKYPPSELKTAPLKDDRSLSEGQISKEFKTSVQAPDYPLNSSQEKIIIQSIYDNDYPDSAERLLHFIENSPYRSSRELAQQYYASLENKTSSFMQNQNEKIKSKAINMAAEEDKVKELLGSENLPSNYKEILGMTEEARVKAALGIPDNVSLPENYKEILQMTDKDKVKMALKIPSNVKLRDDYKQILGIPVEPTEDDTSLSEGQSEVGFVTRDTSPSSAEFGSLDVRNFKQPTKGDISWINDSLLDAIRQKESSNRHLDVDGTLFKHPNSKALGAYGIKPSTAADPGAKFVELNPDLVPIADLTKELNEDKHREFAKNYLIAITLRFPELSPSDVIRAYNAGPTKVNSVLSGQGTFNQEALDYPNQVMEILQSSSNARTGGFV